jgi:hypothetical protein
MKLFPVKMSDKHSMNESDGWPCEGKALTPTNQMALWRLDLKAPISRPNLANTSVVISLTPAWRMS